MLCLDIMSGNTCLKFESVLIWINADYNYKKFQKLVLAIYLNSQGYKFTEKRFFP